jgi:valyl-tRNA synthetase
MSKSLGNGVDPLVVAEQYGADALRFNLVTGNSPGNDMRFLPERCEAMRNFANKIWNASRFVQMNLTIDRVELPKTLTQEDKWILSKLNSLIPAVTDNMESYELGVAAQKVYDFIWDDFCDWYIEFTKARLQGEDPAAKEQAQQVLCYVLTETLKLLHPFMPFLTEEIWQSLPHEGDYLMLQNWPVAKEKLNFPAEEKAVDLLIDVTRAVRGKRAELNVPPSKKAHLTIATAEAEVFTQGIPLLKRLAYASDVTVVGEGESPAQSGLVEVITHVARVFMPLSELVDLEKEKARLQKELEGKRKQLAGLEGKLSNPGFLAKAPEQVVAAEKERAETLKALIAKLEDSLSNME